MNPPIPDTIGRLVAARDLVELAQTLKETRAVTASGLWGSSVAAVVAAMQKELRAPVMLICGHLDEADDLADDIELFCGATAGGHPGAGVERVAGEDQRRAGGESAEARVATGAEGSGCGVSWVHGNAKSMPVAYPQAASS